MTTKRLLIQILIIIAILLTTLLARAAGGVEITFTAAKNELTVGDPVQLTLEVKHPAGYQVIIPSLGVGQNWGDFEVRSQSQAETLANPDGSETTRQTIEVTLFAPGAFQTPPLTLTIRDNEEQISEENTPPVSLTVTPVLAKDDETLLDIKPQAQLAVPPRWPWLLAGLPVAGLLGWGSWRLWRRLVQRRSAPALVIDARLPYQVAFDELARIDHLKLPEQGQFKEHYTLVTDCLRRYLEQQHQVRAFDRTTTELRTSLKQSALALEHTRRLLDLFSEGDLVKFAKFIPALEQARQLTHQARQLVAETHPIPTLAADTVEKPSSNGKSMAPLPDPQDAAPGGPRPVAGEDGR
jgi:hypothetical protein